MMMHSWSFPFLATLLLVLLSVSSVHAGQCYLCYSQSSIPVRWTYRFSNGYTCADIYQFLPTVQDSAAICTNGRNLARNACCNPNAYVASSPTRPPSPPAYQGPVGSEPRCPICSNGAYPRNPGAIIIARYVGQYTCGQLYNRGNYGLISNYMCGPLQDFASGVCGCGSSYSDETSIYADAPASSPGTRYLRGGTLEDNEADFSLEQEQPGDALGPSWDERQLSLEELQFSFLLEEALLEGSAVDDLPEGRQLSADDLEFSTGNSEEVGNALPTLPEGRQLAIREELED